MAKKDEQRDDVMHAENSNAHFAQALEGITFPASKEQLVEQAQRNGADERILGVLNHMPSGTYQIMPDVFKNTQGAIAEYERGR